MKKVKEQSVDVGTVPTVELRHLRLTQVIEIVSVSGRTWLRWVEAGNAPAPVRLGARAVAWRFVDLQKFLASRHLVGSAK